MERIQSFINGSDFAPVSGRYTFKLDPRTGEIIKEVAEGGAEDLIAAADAAAAAGQTWRDLRPSERGRILTAIGSAVRGEVDTLGAVESQETGKPQREMPALMDLTAQFFEYYGGVVNAADGERIEQGPDYHVYTRRDPFGVIGVILPWNAPLHQAARAIAPALAAGNTVVAKPSEHTPGSLVALARLAKSCGLPDGVLNIVVGPGTAIGPAMARHAQVRKISFTGGARAGAELGHIAADRYLPLTLELGGKSANIVFDDADLDAAARGSVRAFTWNSGQWCAAGTRLLVQRSIYDAFVPRLVERVRDLRGGPDPQADYGPVTTKAQFAKILSYFEIAEREGMTLATGGRPAVGEHLGGGWYVEPTVYIGVDNRMTLAREEIFGPVLCVIAFEDEADAVRIANDSEFGLSAGIWSRDIGRVHRVAAQLEAGRIVVNEYGGGFVQTPCGGFKASGYGREQGLQALHEYTQLKSVIIRL